jgi:hypothetical protein
VWFLKSNFLYWSGYNKLECKHHEDKDCGHFACQMEDSKDVLEYRFVVPNV